MLLSKRNKPINIVGNVVGKVDVVERENKNGEAFKVANFSVVSKDDEGNKIYHNCSAYGEKSDIPKDFKQGDFFKLFVQIRTSIDDNGKEHRNIRILSSKLLKAKEQMKGQEEKKESVLGAIKKYQAEDKENSLDKHDGKHNSLSESTKDSESLIMTGYINALYTIRYNKTHCNKNKSLIYCGIRKIITQDIVHKELYRRKIC